jgi:hypothetical protein
MKIKLVFGLLALAGLVAHFAWAQTSSQGVIFGTVTDPSGAVIPETKLTLTHVATGLVRQVVANAQGDFRADFLPPGAYEILAERPAFQTAQLTGITLLVGQAIRVDVHMVVGTTTQHMTVEADVTHINTVTASRGEVIENNEIENLPLNGREFLALTTLVPGAVAGGKEGTDGSRGYTIGFNGSRSNTNSYYLDGGQNTDPDQNQPVSSPSIDAIQEFKIETNLYSARYGQAGGGIISLVTKSGTNRFHGDLFEYDRNHVLDGLPEFYSGTRANSPNSLFNQYGGTIGGPIRKDKTFFFASVEFFHQLNPGSQFVKFAPTALERTGDVSQEVNPFSGGPVVLMDPFTQTVIPSDILPASLISPVGQKLMSLWPQPNYNDPVFNLRYFRSGTSGKKRYTFRVDHNFSPRDVLQGSFDFGNYAAVSPGDTVYGDTNVTYNDRNLTLNYIHSFKPNLLNTLGFTATNFLTGDTPTLDAQNYGKAWGLAPSVNHMNGTPWIFEWTQGLNYWSLGNWSTNNHTTKQGYLNDDLVWVKGSHSLQMGGAYFLQRLDEVSEFTAYYMNLLDGEPGLQSVFGDTGSGFTDMLAAIPNYTTLEGANGMIDRFQRGTYALYLQDLWKVSPRLTLNLGIRWEYEAPFHELDNALMTLDFNTGLPLYAAGAPGVANVTFPHETGGPDTTFPPDKDTFMPRFGFALRPFKSEKTVLRGGYGIFFNSETAYTQRMGSYANPFNGSATIIPDAMWWPDHQNHFFTMDQTPYGVPGLYNSSPGVLSYINPPYYPRAYTQQWSLTLGHELSRDTRFELGYVGTIGVNLPSVNSMGDVYPETAAEETAANPGFSTGLYTKGYGSHYHALQTSVRKTMSNGLQLLASYTWSHSMADASDDYLPWSQVSNTNLAGVFTTHRYWTDTDFDVPNRFSLAGMYELPFGRGRKWGTDWRGVVDKLAGGWNVNFIYSAQSGFPYPVLDPSDRMPDRVCNGNLPKSQRTPQMWFNYNCFPTHVYQTIMINGVATQVGGGDSTDNVIFGPGINNMDLGVHKMFKITERATLEFRMEGFNAFNHPQYEAPNTMTLINTAAGAEITNAYPEREVQFALKLLF